MAKKKNKKSSQKVVEKCLKEDNVNCSENSEKRILIDSNDVVFQQPLDETHLGVGAMIDFSSVIRHCLLIR